MTQDSPSEAVPFWRRKRLDEMTLDEWESLCDGCGRCCLDKLEADDTHEIYYLDVACKLLDTSTSRCTDYPNRVARGVNCFRLEPDKLHFVPPTCAYRLVSEGQDLEWWHPLVSGDPTTVRKAGMSVIGRVTPVTKAGPFEYHTVDWPVQFPPENQRGRWTLAMFGGVNASVPTAFRGGGQVDLDLMANHCFWLLANGCNGLAVLDKAGEVASLAIAERISILDGLVGRGVPASKILAGLGPASAADAARISVRAAALGIRGVISSVSVPSRTMPRDVLPDRMLPVIQAVPAGVHFYLSLSFPQGAQASCLTAIEAIIAHTPNCLRGIRDESPGCTLGLAALDRFHGTQFEVYTSDELSLETLIDHGGAGLIGPGANLLGRYVAEIVRGMRPDQAPRLRRAIETASTTWRSGRTVPIVKALLARHTGSIDWLRVRPPLRAMAPAEQAGLFQAFDASGVRLQPVERATALAT